jgi:Ni,Fe-hydrogenase III small subunit
MNQMMGMQIANVPLQVHLSGLHPTPTQIVSTMANGLLSLPQELHIQILSHLDAISLTHCAMVGACFFRLEGIN